MPLKIPARQLVRSEPFSAQKTFVQSSVAAAGTLSIIFDIASVTTDPTQLQSGVVASSLPTVGPTLDALIVSDHIGTLDVLAAVDVGAAFISILPAPIAMGTGLPVQINGLRTPGRYIELLYTNTSGATALTDFGAYMRSN
jgi:hypothetical protein